jgi:hypothetical protein
MASDSAPEQVAPVEDLADLHLHAAEPVRARQLDRLHRAAGDEVELDRQARAAVQRQARGEARAVRELVGRLDAVGEHVLPRDQHAVHDQDRVVLVQAAGQRVVERAAHHSRGHLV